MRKLASIQVIKELRPINGADRIEEAIVLGWHVVVQKGLYKEGDRVVYLETDSVLPKSLAEKAGFTDSHLKVRRFKGIYSQGMCLPVSEVVEEILLAPGSKEHKIALIQDGRYDDVDVTEMLGITKWEPDERNRRHHGRSNTVQIPKKWYTRFRIGRWFWKKFIYKPKSINFPSWIPKTDETRIQVLSDVLEKHTGVGCEYTEKVDGSSITIWYDRKKDKLHVCSRNREILDKTDYFYTTAMKYLDKIKSLPDGIVLQGELLGPNIQQNKYRLEEKCILFYQAWAKNRGEYLNPPTFRTIMSIAGLKTVPLLGSVRLSNDVDYFVDLSVGTSALNPEVQREGIVIRPLANIKVQDRRFVDGRLSLKAINPKFLIKYDL